VQVGDRAAGSFKHGLRASSPAKKSNRLWGAIDGMLVEYVVLHQDGVVLLPDHLSMKKVQRFPCGSHSWHALCIADAGETVLEQVSFDLRCNLPLQEPRR